MSKHLTKTLKDIWRQQIILPIKGDNNTPKLTKHNCDNCGGPVEFALKTKCEWCGTYYVGNNIEIAKLSELSELKTEGSASASASMAYALGMNSYAEGKDTKIYGRRYCNIGER
jgi:hypothetical protein